MTRSVTLRMDEESLRRLRHSAADAGMSLSAWIASTLEGLVPKDGQIEDARIRPLQRLERGFPLGGKPLTRDELNTR